jgi:YhcH/YjgK/YiaL family protein
VIFDTLDNARLYFGCGTRIEKGLRFLAETDLAALPMGKLQIDGADVYAMVQEYDSKPRDQGKWEAHRKFIDIQYIAAGIERMGFAQLARVKPGPYNEEKDMLTADGQGDWVTTPAGTFVIFHPQDVHMPGMAIDNPSRVRKVVVKVRA